MKTSKGRDEYIDWLNHREKRWEVYQANEKKRTPRPVKYGVAVNCIGIVRLLDYLENDDVKPLVVSVTPAEIDFLLKEARKRFTEEKVRAQADYDNWCKHRDTGLLLIPPAAHKP